MEKIKIFIVDILIWSGIFTPFRSLWMVLEYAFDGGVQESISDSLISIIIVTMFWWKIRNWIVIKDDDVDR